MSEMRPDIDAGPMGRQCSESNGPAASPPPDCARPINDGLPNARAAAMPAAIKRELFIDVSPEVGIAMGESIYLLTRSLRRRLARRQRHNFTTPNAQSIPNAQHPKLPSEEADSRFASSLGVLAWALWLGRFERWELGVYWALWSWGVVDLTARRALRSD